MVKSAEKQTDVTPEAGRRNTNSRVESIGIEQMDRDYRRLLIGEALRHGSREPEDVVQEVMIKAHKALSKEVPATLTRGWYLRVTATTAIDLYRRAKHRDDYGLTWSESEYEKYVEETPDTLSDRAFDEVDSRLFVNRVQKRVDELLEDKPHWKEMYKLYFIDGLTQEEISRRLGKPNGTVRSTIYRIKDLLAGDPEIIALNEEK